MRGFMGFIAGLVFGLGLVISGMSDPAKVLNFLDIAALGSTWDPSLAFVMGGASVTAFIGYRLVWRHGKPLLMDTFQIPTASQIDRPLITGAVLFGIGWGIGGFCPGPAWTAVGLLEPGTLVFVPMMLLGFWIGGRAKSLPLFSKEAAA